MCTIVAFIRIECVRDNKMDIIVVQNNRNMWNRFAVSFTSYSH